MPDPVNSALRILLMVAAGRGRAMQPSRIAVETGVTLPTATRLLRELADAGFLEQKSRREGYVTGPLAFYLGGGCRYREEVMRKLDVPLRELSQRFKARAELSIRIGFARHILFAFEAGEVVDPPPLSAGLYATAAGRLLFALAPETSRIHLIWEHGVPDRLQWPEAADSRERLREQLEGIRRRRMHSGAGSIAVAVDSEIVISLDTAELAACGALEAVAAAGRPNG